MLLDIGKENGMIPDEIKDVGIGTKNPYAHESYCSDAATFADGWNSCREEMLKSLGADRDAPPGDLVEDFKHLVEEWKITSGAYLYDYPRGASDVCDELRTEVEAIITKHDKRNCND